jgi:hypothetical protein
MLMIMFSVSVFASIPHSDKIMYWYPFIENNSATNVSSSVGLARVGTISGDAVITADGMVDNGIRCYGAGKIAFTELVGTNYNQSTYNFWYKANSFTADAGMLGLYYSNSNYAFFGFRTDLSGMMYQYFSPQGTATKSNSGVGKTTSGWHMATLVQDGNYMHMYLDGERVVYDFDRRQGVSYDYYPNINAKPSLCNWAWNQGGNYFIGYIDEFSAWNYSLEADDVEELYNSGNAQTYQDVVENPYFYEYPVDYDLEIYNNGYVYKCGTGTYLPCPYDKVYIKAVNIDNPLSEYNQTYDVKIYYYPAGNSSLEDFVITTTQGINEIAQLPNLDSGEWTAYAEITITSGADTGNTATTSGFNFYVAPFIIPLSAENIDANSGEIPLYVNKNGFNCSTSYKYKPVANANWIYGTWETCPVAEASWITLSLDNLSYDTDFMVAGLINVPLDNFGNTGNVTYTTLPVYFSTSLVGHQIYNVNASFYDYESAIIDGYVNSSVNFWLTSKYKKSTDASFTYTTPTGVWDNENEIYFTQGLTGLSEATNYLTALCIIQTDYYGANITYCSNIINFTTASISPVPTATPTGNETYIPTTASGFWSLVLGNYNTTFIKLILGFVIIMAFILGGAYLFGKWNQQFGGLALSIFTAIGVVFATILQLIPIALLILLLVAGIIIIILKQMLFSNSGQGG